MGNRRREGRTTRWPTTSRRLVTRLLIVCGGRQTEKQYFDGLLGSERNAAVSVKIKPRAKSPTEVVRYAQALRRDNRDDFDEVWCVLDVDEFQDVAAAVALARRSGIKMAISNPCFELWLLLHISAHNAAISTRDVQRLLRKQLPSYDKSDLSFADFAAGVRDACERGRLLDPTGDAHDVNPSTGVWRVAAKIQRHDESAR
jgi:hypothetical protein